MLRGIVVDQDNVVVSAIKQAECGDGYVLRAYECDGRETVATLDCKGVGKVTASFGKYEVKTFHFHGDVCEEVLFTEFKE
jgi:hypothetical protein